MEGNSSQFLRDKKENGSNNLKNNVNRILIKLEEDGFVTPDEKVKELIKEVNEPKRLLALKLLFEDLQSEFSSKVLINSLFALADPTPFNLYYSKESVSVLELHLRTWIVVLERICFSPIRLTKELRDKVYNSLAKFAEIHRKTTQVMEEGLENNFRYNFNQQIDDKDDEKIIKKRNYNIDFLLIHLRDTLHSLRDDEHWLQEIMRRMKDILKAFLNITPGVLSIVAPEAIIPIDNCAIWSILAQLRLGLSFKYVASYYVDWRIMLIIRHNIVEWAEDSKKIISKKHAEMILMEYLWSFLEREWNHVADKAILESQSKFDEVSNKVSKTLRNTRSLLSDLAGNEPIALPHTLWFGILDLAHDLIKTSSRTATHGLCYYLASESLKRAPSSFIQFKTIEILLYLNSINNKLFSIIELDFHQYTNRLKENNFLKSSSEKFQNILVFAKEKHLEDLKLNDDDDETKGKGKGKCSVKNTLVDHEHLSKSYHILDLIANEITCPISREPTNQLCILKCQHEISLNSLKKLKQTTCPQCREKIEDNEIRYVSQNTIYKNLYSQFLEAGHLVPLYELESSDQIKGNQYDSDSDDISEIDLILTKKNELNKTLKLKSSISLQSIFQIKSSKKQHPIYKNVVSKLSEKNYDQAIFWCQKFLEKFPKSYSMRCILAYTYRFINNYKQAHLYLNEAIRLKPKKQIALYIRGEIYFRQKRYEEAIECLKNEDSKNLNLIVGFSYLICGGYHYWYAALRIFNSVLKNDPKNYLCLKYCVYANEKQGHYLNALTILDILLSINKDDSLILCYYGEVLSNLERYNEAISYFTKANFIDPENVYNLCKRAITYYLLEMTNEALLDLNKALQLNSSYDLAYYYRGLTFYTIRDFSNSILDFEKCVQLNPSDNVAKAQLYYLEYLLAKKNNKVIDRFIIAKINQIPNIDMDISSIFIRCKIYIELEQYDMALIDFNILFEYNRCNISYTYLLQKYSNFWKYLYNHHKINDNEFVDFGIVEKFDIFMYKGTKNFKCYLIKVISLTEYSFIQEDFTSFSRKVLEINNGLQLIILPKLPHIWIADGFYIIWKICINNISSKDCSLNFIIKTEKDITPYENTLQYKDLLKLSELGWIEYVLPQYISTLECEWIQPSIEIKNGFINMKIDYIRFSFIKTSQLHFKMGKFISYYKLHSNIPEAFEDKYFQKKELENLLELEEILNHL
ncbi:16799_t:CDS:2 [Funneliformis geosporum]|uniref:3874_t:CDS:1 n=1 Tax=Funneliformis geosporum TaxID=1117311 RepID=A0A9W4SNJ7_9GLOM|nr:3874_t:CDS:2 [Funneliformis geosporum]CAI2179403.1 16799_t:CDS:2 [Funneliformis geosporum]